MGYIRVTYYAGKTAVVKEIMKRKTEKGRKRAPKSKVTSDEVWEYNLQEAIFKATLALNNNFQPGDHHLQFTYKEEPASRAAARNDIKKAIRKITNECKKLGIEFKWFLVTQKDGKNGPRFHHHMVCSRIPMKIIEKCWPHGTVWHNPLWDDPDYSALANYLLREADKLHKEEGIISKRRYTTSRNIVMPEPRYQELKKIDLQKEPAVHAGYQLKQDTVEYYENKIVDTKGRKYVLVEDDAAKRYKRSGKKIMATGEYINWSKALREAYDEYQMDLNDIGLIM